MINYIENKKIFLDEVYVNEETKTTMISNYKNNILYVEKLLEKDLMYFTTEEIESLILNATGVSSGYKSSMYSFCNSYCEYQVDKGNININPCSAIKATDIVETSVQQLMKGLLGKQQFNNTIKILESKTNMIATGFLALCLARNGVLGKKCCDLIKLEEEDIRNDFINIYNKVDNNEDYGLLLTSLPVDNDIMKWYYKYKDIKEYEGLGTRKSKIILKGKYILKKSSYTSTRQEEYISVNGLLNMINQNCIMANIPRISLSKMQMSYKLDMLLDIRKQRRINEYDIKKINKMVNYNFTSAQSVINFKQFYESISGEEVLKGNRIEYDNGKEFVKNLRIRINYF